jgi:hypothetical protein
LSTIAGLAASFRGGATTNHSGELKDSQMNTRIPILADEEIKSFLIKEQKYEQPYK